MDRNPLVIIGAGPAGLAAAHELALHGVCPLVVERGARVGGMARTEELDGYRFDIGGHRFFTRIPEIQALWEAFLPEGFQQVSRLSRIHYRNRFIRYPLELTDVLRRVGLPEGARMLASYGRARLRPQKEAETFAAWVSHRFGERLFERFFRAYTEKVWGVPCDRLHADLAAERIQGLSLGSAVWSALTGRKTHKTLTDRFLYPDRGPGMLWEACRGRVEALGGEVLLNAGVAGLTLEGDLVKSVTVEREGRAEEISVSGVISSAPLRDLAGILRPAPPPKVMRAAGEIRYRDFLLVGLVLDRENLFPDQWIYVHDPGVAAGRIQNFRNWSAKMVPDPRTTSLGMEYFCTRGDHLWNLKDDALIELARRDLEQLGLARAGDVLWGAVFRQTEAYPLHLLQTREHVHTLRAFLARVSNLRSAGRNGLHRYDNQDQAMLTGLEAARRFLPKR